MNLKLTFLFALMIVFFDLVFSADFSGTLADERRPIPPAEAIRQIGKPSVIVQMKVKKAKDRLSNRGIVYLDSEEDFNDPSNLGIAISTQAAEKYKQKGISNLADYFQGKVIRVSGCVMRFESRPYLPVFDPQQIKIVKEE
ncbi:MAG: hypothetical protein D6735_11930 [Acidobacteria bacterium]|nr:MAG: hypothetical protein D6735_11930 [Acidobacteriota bacterium]